MALAILCIVLGLCWGGWIGYRWGWAAALRLRRNQVVDAAYQAEDRDRKKL